jgi:predicted metalloprotease
MDTEGRRRSDNFEDRGQGAGGGRAGMALPIQALFGLVRILGIKGTVVVAAVLGVGYFLLPSGIKQQLLGSAGGPANGEAGATRSPTSPTITGRERTCPWARTRRSRAPSSCPPWARS